MRIRMTTTGLTLLPLRPLTKHMMRLREIIYPQPSLRFYNHRSGRLQDSIVEELGSGLWQEYSIDNMLYNDKLGEMHITEWRELFPSITPIMPGFVYNSVSGQIEEERYLPKRREKLTLPDFLAASERFFGRYEGKKIGVHLSGGLDSSLIICLLHHFGIPFNLYGMVNDRYEFRTERRVQEVLAPLGERTCFVHLEEHPFFSLLDQFPFHQIPDSYVKSYDSASTIAEEAKRDGVEVIFGGQGADTLFVDPIPTETGTLSFNLGNEFTVPWEEDLIYRPRGIELVSFYADPDIIDAICSLRQGQGQDPRKLWARHFFRNFLPRELAEYSYAADFNGLSLSGLELAKPTVERLFEEAYDLTKHPIFSPENTQEMRETNVFEFDYHLYTAYCTRISIAVWIHALFEHSEVR